MILVTGSSGRVGRSLVSVLLKQKERVRTLEKKESVELENVENIQGDILNVDTVKKAVEGADVIITWLRLLIITRPQRV